MIIQVHSVSYTISPTVDNKTVINDISIKDASEEKKPTQTRGKFFYEEIGKPIEMINNVLLEYNRNLQTSYLFQVIKQEKRAFVRKKEKQ